jgi:hypothetical protein
MKRMNPMRIDPLHDPRVEVAEKEKKQRAAKDGYQTPDFALQVGSVIFILLLFIILALVFNIH